MKKYTIDDLKSLAGKYTTKADFKRGSYGAYSIMLRRRVTDECCGHMVPGKHGNPPAYTDQQIAEAFLRHKTLAIKRSADGHYYRLALHRYGHGSAKWKEITAHMEPPTVFGGHQIYVYEFSGRAAYVGQTRRDDRRFNDHQKVGPVAAHLANNPGVAFELKVLESQLLSKVVREREDHWQKKYISEGWKPLWDVRANRAGGMGCYSLLTKEQIMEAAKQCKTRNEFWTRFQQHAKLAKKRGWFEVAVFHMPKIVPIGEETRRKQSESAKARPQRTAEQMAKMNEASQKSFAEKRVVKAAVAEAEATSAALAFKEQLRKRFLAHKTRKSLLTSDQSAYVQAKRHGWYAEFCSHMESPASVRSRVRTGEKRSNEAKAKMRAAKLGKKAAETLATLCAQTQIPAVQPMPGEPPSTVKFLEFTDKIFAATKLVGSS